jgi:hypothetical protein
VIFIFVGYFDLCFINNYISPIPLAMPEGGGGAAYPDASPDEGRWVPLPVALARQRAQEVVRHASTLPPAGVAEAPSPKPDATSPQCKGGEDSVAAEPLRGEGVIRPKHIYNFLCSMLVYTPFALCFVTLHGILCIFWN